MLPFLNGYLLHAINLRYRLIPSRLFADQRIQQSDWLRVFKATAENPDFAQTCGFLIFRNGYALLR